MPRDKDLKRLVRARMRKTGEAYTTARAQIVRKPRRNTARPASTAPTTTTDLAATAGMADSVVAEKTGRTWKEWVELLDAKGAQTMKHRDIAAMLHDTYGIAHWWTQMITVGYERIKGMRAKGQRLDGSYEANKSRTFDAPLAALYQAFANATTRRRWLDEPGVKVRTATTNKSMRLGLPDGTIVAFWFTAKGKTKSALALAHTKLRDRTAVDRRKQFWTAQLDRLGEVLAAR